MTLGRCPLSIFCSRGTPPVEPTNPESITNPNFRCRANSAHIRQSRPDSGLDLHLKVLKTFQVVPFSLGSS